MSDEQQRKAAYDMLDEAVRLLHQFANDDDDDPPSIPTDYALVVGNMYIDNDGDRCGYVVVYPRQGCQPAYITVGLVTTAQKIVQRLES
ncbi:DUF7213 family protein [Mycobacteroides chelonae]|uniref:DUF7213 family protein n=1 Tax=Mycobacteroides chelonae TaxID=1774 RepID=UPI0038776434